MQEYACHSSVIVRYADDAIFFFEERKVALEFKQKLEERVRQYGLTLNQDKTKMLRLTKSNHIHFHFLCFTFYWGKHGRSTCLKIKTQKEKLHKSIREFEQWIKENRNRWKLKKLWEKAKVKIMGHINYFGFRMNEAKLNHFYYQAIRALFKWLNRRSQKQSYNWDSFKERLKHFPLIPPIEMLKLKQLGYKLYKHR